MNDSKIDSSRWHFRLPYRSLIERALEHFSFAEKVIFYILAAAMLISASILLFRVNDFLLVEVPAPGGSLSEGIIGSPRFINPLLAISDADRDLTALVYSGLLRARPDGTLIPDLAESYTVSEDGLTYDFILKNNTTFHDGTPVTTEDVEFTVLKAQDPNLKSPKRANWDSVQVERVNGQEIRFILKQPYAPFLENTTMGILPKHIWKNVTNEEFPLSFFNFEPVGSGPFIIGAISRNSSGIPGRYTFSPFNEYALGRPYLDTLFISFYPNEQLLLSAFSDGDIESVNSVTPSAVGTLKLDNSNLVTIPLSRIFGVFFNQNQAAIFADPKVRQALDRSLDKGKIVSLVLSGFGVPIDGPLPPGFLAKITKDDEVSGIDKVSAAQAILEGGGWVKNENGTYQKTDKKKKTTQTLSFSISTSNAPELKHAAELVRDTWQSMGALVELKVFEPGDLSQNIIRPRKYDAILFGEIIGRDLDLFAFWHSSQRNDPGLNIALYTNTKADKLLSDARTISDRETRLSKYREFEMELSKETPAVFLYSPSFVYILPKKIQGVDLGHITVPSDRFENISEWYENTEKIWKIFINNSARAQR